VVVAAGLLAPLATQTQVAVASAEKAAPLLLAQAVPAS
jgi:hypothetical protein